MGACGLTASACPALVGESSHPPPTVPALCPTFGRRGPGTIKHGRFCLAGQPMAAMDSHIDHGFTFNEGVSFQVLCADQAEVDHYWAALCEGGAPGRCGWLKDRFGVSWQVVPSQLAGRLTADAGGRVFKALLGMDKLDLDALEAAVSVG